MLCYRRCFFSAMLLLLLRMNLGNTLKECKDCDNHPNGLGTKTKSQCGFRLSCKKNKVTMLEFPEIAHHPTLHVTHIDYTSQRLFSFDPDDCLPRLFLRLYNSSIYPFQFDSDQPYTELDNVTFFDCSSDGASNYRFNLFRPQNMMCPIIIARSNEYVVESNLVLCTRMFQLVSPVPAENLASNNLTLKWSQENCDPEKFYCKPKQFKIPASIILPATGLIVLVSLLIVFFRIYRHFRMKGDDQARVEMFLKDYRALKPTRFSYADLKRITNYFRVKLGEGAHGAVFKGKLSNEISVAVKMLNNSDGDGQEFINEVGTMGKIHHLNVVRLLGFCADGFYRALIYDFFPNGSLQNFITPPDNKDIFLGWEKLQQIANGIAKGIEYLHQGCDQRILHFDINPHNVLLDHNFTPKISDFGLAKLCSKNRSTVSMTAARGTLGYIAPEVFSRNFGNVSYKSDIYSYGMLMLEMVVGKKNTNTSEEAFQVLYPEWIHNLVEDRDISILIEDEEGIKIAKKLAIVGLWCIQWHPLNRPSIKTVIQMLEGEGDKLKAPSAPFDSTTSASTSVIVPGKRMNLELDVIHEFE